MKRKKVHNCRVVKHNLEPKNRHPFQQVLRPVDAVSMHNTMHVNVNRLCPMIVPIQGLFLMQSILELVYLVLTYNDHLVFRLWIPENIMFFVEKYLSYTKEQRTIFSFYKFAQWKQKFALHNILHLPYRWDRPDFYSVFVWFQLYLTFHIWK